MKTFSERRPAVGIDMAAAERAAQREVASATRQMIHDHTLGRLRLRQAVLRLSVALGNQSHAETWLADNLLAERWVLTDPSIATDTAALNAAVQRSDAHPELMESLREIEAKIAEQLRQLR